MVTFETVEAITGRPGMNAMRPRMTRPQTLDDVATGSSALCAGVLNDINRGDWLLLARSSTELKRAEKVLVDPASQTTRVDFTAQPVGRPVFLPLLANFVPIVRSMVGQVLSPSVVAGEIKGVRRKQQALEAEFRSARLSRFQLSRHLWAIRPILFRPIEPQGLFHFRARAAIFGHNVPNEAAAGATRSPSVPTIGQACVARILSLDTEVRELRPGSWIAFSRLVGASFITRIQSVDTATASYGKLSGRVSRVTLEQAFPSDWTNVSVADVTVLADARPINLAPLPVTEDVVGAELRLDRYIPGLAAGTPVAVTGERSDLLGVVESEVHKIRDVEIDDGFSVITLASAIAGPFARSTVSVNANVALATHGESGGQPIGHGDASAEGQMFRLPVVPLTHVGAANPKGLAAELEIRVDGILWSEVPSLRDAGRGARVYALRYADDGSVWVRFGDGKHGRRLPTGTNNVVARWRKGSGREGMVQTGQLSLLSGAPQGVKGATNPLPATGAADGETLDEARANAPLSVLTLDRIVTLRDYEDFARAFGGISKARAVWAWNGRARAVAITVAGAEGAVPTERDIDNLRTAITRASDSAATLAIMPYRPAWFRLQAIVNVDPAHSADVVLAAVESSLRDEFSFERRDLGQPVARSEVIRVIQSVPGVDWVDLDFFYRGDTPVLADMLFAEASRSGIRLGFGAAPVAAELLSIYPGAPDLRVAR
ncbi:MAG TPA: putative baseplate assembly protein [Sphingomicrobium sp.]|nr:putative baseplate assembly protein [Sphingomicrobium sp.]